MSWMTDLPFERKLRYAILGTSMGAVLLACGIFLAIEYKGYRESLERNVHTLGRITASNSTAAIAFEDTERARQILAALHAEPQVFAAALCRTDGRIVATYTDSTNRLLPELPPPKEGVRFEGSYVVSVQPVVEGTRWLGTLYVWATMDVVYGRMRIYALSVLGVLAASLAFAWLLSTLLQRTISRPVVELAQTAGAVTAGQDFSLRARQYGNDELGRLTAAFNAMLERTQTAVAALRASEAQLRIVTDNASVFLAQCDRELRFKFVNRPYAERFGVSPQNIVGRRVEEVIGKAATEVIEPFMQAALQGERVEFENELHYPTGPRWMHIVYMPERATNDEVVGFVAIITDITHRKQIEQDVARARDEALAASRAKDDFLAALSHELRTPLSPVLLLASEAVQDPGLPPAVRADFETVRKNVELEARLIDDLLDLTAITRGKLSLDRRPVDVHAVLRDALATVSSDLKRKRIRLVVETDARRPEVHGDAVRLQQVFWNVLKNAVKFTPEGGRIVVKSSCVDDNQRVRVRITDSGIGLTPAERDRIFDAFSQGEHAGDGAHRFGGLGLGLAISRMVIELHHGTIAAQSDGRGHGASFEIDLPLVAQAEPEATSTEALLLAGAAGDSAEGHAVNGDGDHAMAAEIKATSHGSILLVEDHAATRTALERLLTRRHYRVLSAASLADAREHAAREKFDLLISDVGLPDGSGYDLMREFGPRYRVPGIALTGYGMEQDQARSFRAGFSAHLTKPVRVQALDAALAEVLRPMS